MRLTHLRYLVVKFDTNIICNLRCKMCHFNDRGIKKTSPINVSDFEKIAQRIFPLTRVLYLSCVAEPLCTPNIGDYIASAKRHGVPFVSMTSNCMLLNEQKAIALINSGLNELVISVTGGTAGTYEENHVGANWEIFWGNLNGLRKKKEALGSSRPEIKFNYILTKRSMEETSQFIEMIKPFAPRYITFRELVPFTGMNSEYYEKNRLRAVDFLKILEIKQIFRRHGIEPIDSLQCTDETKLAYKAIPEVLPCIEPFFQVFIDPKGNLQFCNHLPVIVNILENSFDAIMKSREVRTFFRSLQRKSQCPCIRTCPYFSITSSQ